jgi:hypothetical protein
LWILAENPGDVDRRRAWDKISLPDHEDPLAAAAFRNRKVKERKVIGAG